MSWQENPDFQVKTQTPRFEPKTQIWEVNPRCDNADYWPIYINASILFSHRGVIVMTSQEDEVKKQQQENTQARARTRTHTQT